MEHHAADKNDWKQATDMYIHLKGIRLYAYHGVLPQENRVGAQYTIDLRLKTDFTLAAETDRLEGTINYADVIQCRKRRNAHSFPTA